MNNKFLYADFCLLECDISVAEVASASIYKATWHMLYSKLNAWKWLTLHNAKAIVGHLTNVTCSNTYVCVFSYTQIFLNDKYKYNK